MFHKLCTILLTLRESTPSGPYAANADAQVAPDLSKAFSELMADSVAPFTNDKMNDVYGVYDWWNLSYLK